MVCRHTRKVIGKLDNLLDNTLYCHFSIVFCLYFCIFILLFPVTVSSQVTGVTVSKAVKSERPTLMVTWTTPLSDVSISQYQVQYRRSGTTSWSSAAPVSGSTTSTYLEELVAGSEYQVRVRAVSAIGNGVWSAVQSETTYNMCELTTDLTGVGNFMYAHDIAHLVFSAKPLAEITNDGKYLPG